VVEPKEGKGSRRRLLRLGVPDGLNAASAVAACVRAPVCFGCDYGCGSRVGKADQEQGLRDAKTLVRDVKLLGEVLVEVLR
jgi:hypothetical protein